MAAHQHCNFFFFLKKVDTQSHNTLEALQCTKCIF